MKARVSIDKKELTALLNEYLSEKISDKNISVGAVVRFIIDGKLADGKGSDSQNLFPSLVKNSRNTVLRWWIFLRC